MAFSVHEFLRYLRSLRLAIYPMGNPMAITCHDYQLILSKIYMSHLYERGRIFIKFTRRRDFSNTKRIVISSSACLIVIGYSSRDLTVFLPEILSNSSKSKNDQPLENKIFRVINRETRRSVLRG